MEKLQNITVHSKILELLQAKCTKGTTEERKEPFGTSWHRCVHGALSETALVLK